MDSNQLMVYVLFFGLPGLSVIWFLVNLIVFLTAKKNSRRKEDFRGMMIISGVLAAVLVGVVVSLMLVTLYASKTG